MGELDMIDPRLHHAYRLCRELNERHGKTYFLATRLLPAAKRAGVHALYGFARMVDDIVDVDVESDRVAAAKLDAFEHRIREALDGRPLGRSRSDLVLSALVDTTARYNISHEYYYAFLHSMRMDIPGTEMFRSRYRTMDELSEYMYGSAAVIGLEMLPILGTEADRDAAAEPAAALGEAFQLTNFIRDMGEDLDRDRIYLPTDELNAFGVDEDLLHYCRTTGRNDVRLDRALAHLIAHTRTVYRKAEPGIDMLDAVVRPAMRTAFVLYGDILREVEDSGYRVLHQRARVPQRRRLSVAAPRLAEAGWVALHARLALRGRIRTRSGQPGT
ncbi:phytoene/squalene synthase family protein [Rhodococcus chondri]|uniref:Phytoene/squalene synthase family protein n=1 Tax=Rhodococcus chondri TaxID=3065941 RepID=A0ABU7JKU2_9NOCA|nr:phytoene/squalene synthase family protein [Rhodococcus sp. CC-R104]MEE2030660.1 phytoene/squalene synthase family protein [Rhodococcus sp. CC-R104]